MKTPFRHQPRMELQCHEIRYGEGSMVRIGQTIGLEELDRVVHRRETVALDPEAFKRIEAGRAIVESRLGDGLAHYGINTGFGALAEVPIPRGELAQLQWNLVRSHAAGVREPLREEEVRAAMLLRAQVLATGLAGVRPEVAILLVEMLNRGVHPVIPSRGSVGASGDLAPLAHMALVMVGEGRARWGEEEMGGAQALARAGLSPLELQPKEGLALVNGTQVLTAVGAVALWEAIHLVEVADLIGAMTLEAALGTPDAFDPRVLLARPHPGQVVSGRRLQQFLKGSDIRESHRSSTHRVQDPYSLRCMPQVHGAVQDCLEFVRKTVVTEMNSATDNPLVFPEGAILSGGNFHGEPVAMALDFLAIAAAELGSISERRVEHLLNPALSEGLSPFLATHSGLCSGYMMAQVSAASLVTENKILAHPASVDSIPSSANREDHVSMGMTSALKARQVVENVRWVLALEALCAAAGIDQRAPRLPGTGVRAAHRLIREVVPPLDGDRPVGPDADRLQRMLRPGGGLLEGVRAAIADQD